jgi:uroporphyrinogen-III synthase
MPFVIATKKLSDTQKNLLIQGGVEVTDYNAIQKYRLENTNANFRFPVLAIVTSVSATEILLERNPRFDRLYVVGQRSADLLVNQGFQPDHIAEYGSELARYISDHHPKDQTLHFFCSRQRRDELPELLKSNGFDLAEVHLYDIKQDHRSFRSNIDGVLFLSPSAVRSFCEANVQRDFMAFCIGKTTAAEAEKYQLKTIVANATSYESLIAVCVKYFKG